MITTDGFNYLLSSGFKQGTQHPNFYIGLYTGTYKPQKDDNLAKLLANVTEVTAYTSDTRVELVLGYPANGGLDNTASVAEFTGNATSTINGAFVVTSSGKGATSGLLIAAEKFDSPETLKSAGILKLTSGFMFANPA